MTKIHAAVLFLLAGIAVLVFTGHRWRRWRGVHGWQPVRGEIVEARVEEFWDFNHGMLSRAPVVEYRYRAGTREFTGRRITVHDRHLASLDRRDVQVVLDGIDPRPLVYVDPADPGNAVLVNRLEKAHFGYLLTRFVIGALLMAVSVVLMTVVLAAG